MTELTKEVLAKLAEPFPASAISVKIQTKPREEGKKALCVAYIDARDVMNRLDEVVGGEWSDDYRAGPSGGVHCSLTVCGVTRCDVGADDNKTEAEKSGYSDAFKRAAVKFGIGRFLYSLPKMWGAVRKVGENFYLADGEEARLQNEIAAALNGHKSPTKIEKATKLQAELDPGMTGGDAPKPPAPANPEAPKKMVKPMLSDQIAWAALQWECDKSTAARKINGLHLPALMEEAEFKQKVIAIKQGAV